jgi:hypothetical protein
MPFVVTRVSERPSVRYVKTGRLVPGDDGYIRVIRDGIGEIGTVHKADLLLILGGLGSEEFRLSESGNRVIFRDCSGQEFSILTKQVRGMLEDWPKKKAAVWVVG